MSEYYDNTQDWNLKTEIVLGLTDDIVLNDIYLAEYQVYAQFSSSPYNVPSEGGTVQLRGSVTNTTGAPLPVVAWVNVINSSSTGAFVTVLQTEQTLPAGTLNFKLPVQIPAIAPAGTYCFYMHAGKSVWEPISNSYASCIEKTSGLPALRAPEVTTAEERRVPARLSKEGAVLEWR
jgi:hypothetical protein